MFDFHFAEIGVDPKLVEGDEDHHRIARTRPLPYLYDPLPDDP